jgi:hypothetical protein
VGASSVATQLVSKPIWTEISLFNPLGGCGTQCECECHSSVGRALSSPRWLLAGCKALEALQLPRRLRTSEPGFRERAIHAPRPSPSNSGDEEGLVEPYSGAIFLWYYDVSIFYYLPHEAPILALGKRRRDGNGAPVIIDSYEIPSQKRVRGGKTNRILKATRPAT